MWGPSEAEWKFFIWTAAIILLMVGAFIGAFITWLI